MNDPELDRRWQAFFAKASVLSEAEAAGTEGGDTAHTKPESRAPAGVRLGDTTNQPPPIDRSLADHYRWRLEHARTDRDRRLLLYLAERALEERLGRRPEFVTPMNKLSPDERDERILTWYVGVSALEVAILETSSASQVSEMNVRKVRRLAGRNPDDGTEPAHDPAREEARRLKRQTYMSIREIALRVGKSKSTVERWLSGKTDEEAA